VSWLLINSEEDITVMPRTTTLRRGGGCADSIDDVSLTDADADADADAKC
jgi:hypothetical protein